MRKSRRLLTELSDDDKSNILMAIAQLASDHASSSDMVAFFKKLAGIIDYPEHDAISYLTKKSTESHLYLDLPRRVRKKVLVIGLMAALYCGSCSEQCKNNIALFSHHLGINPSMPKRIFHELYASHDWKDKDIIDLVAKYSVDYDNRYISYIGLFFASVGAISSFRVSFTASLSVGIGVMAVTFLVVRMRLFARSKTLDNYKIDYTDTV